MQVAALQDSSSGSSTDFIDVSQEIDQEQALAELQAVEKEIQELKESLAKGAPGLVISKDDAEARSISICRFHGIAET